MEKISNKQIGRVGLSMAINYFTLNGYTISLPLNDTQWYDLIVEKDAKFQTIQCKATQTEDGEINMQSNGGTNGSAYDNIINHLELDYIFAVNKDLECWLIPMEEIIKSGVTRSFCLRTTLAPTAHPKLDTTKYKLNFKINN